MDEKMKNAAWCPVHFLLALAIAAWAPQVSAEDLYRKAHEIGRAKGGTLLGWRTACPGDPRVFWDSIHGGSCWRCPDDAPRRTVFSVDGPTACVGTKPVPSADCFTAHVSSGTAKCEADVDFYVSAYNENDHVTMIALVDTKQSLKCPDRHYRQVKLCDAKVIVPGKKYQVGLAAITSATCTSDYCSSENFTSKAVHPPSEWTCDVKGGAGRGKQLACRPGKP